MKTSEASLKYIKGSFYKLNDVARLIRGMSVRDANAQLMFCQKRIAGSVRKLLLSCIANAKNNYGMNEDSLVINRVDVGKAFVLKRSMPCGRGRSSRIEKRYSNLRIILTEKMDKVVRMKNIENVEKNIAKKKTTSKVIKKKISKK